MDKLPVGAVAYVLVPTAIREDEYVRVHFPVDITAEEAERVARVIKAYVIEPDRTPNPLSNKGDTHAK